MASEHTPGPWKWHRIGSQWILVGDHSDLPFVIDCGNIGVGPMGGTKTRTLRVRGEVCMVPLDPTHPDAALIAAAPDLLAALQHMQACGDCAQDSWNLCEGGRAALAAIAKATPAPLRGTGGTSTEK